jgi:hypothetical protein
VSNNDTTLLKLLKTLKFNPKERRLYYIGYIINLITKAYLFRQDIKSFNEDFKAVGPLQQRQL